MCSTERIGSLPALRPTPLLGGTQRRLRLGRMEAAVVQLLLAQRERSSQQGSHVPLALTVEALAEQLGLAYETPAERQRVARHLQQTIWRANAKLAAQDLTIASLYALGQGSYAIFGVSELWEAPPAALKRETA